MGQPGSEPYDPNADYPGYQPVAPASGGQQNPYPQYVQGQYPGLQYAPGYPQPYPAGYPTGRYGPQRPGQATSAAVLGYVAGGLLIAAGLLLFVGASLVTSFDAINSGGHTLLTAELVVDGVLDLVAGGLLIAGAAVFTSGANNGRIMLSVGAGIVIALSIYWVARTSGAAVVWALIFAALVIVSLSLAWTRVTTQWLTGVTNLGPR